MRISRRFAPAGDGYQRRRSRYYHGPVSDHFDGMRFFDPAGAPPRSRADLLRWMIGSRWRGTRAKWPAWAASPYADRPPARVEGAACRLSYVGHASWLIQTSGVNMLLDPVWSERASPFRMAGPKRLRGSPLRICRLLMWCWCRTPTTITSTLRPCHESR